jgi:hypothetical protein
MSKVKIEGHGTGTGTFTVTTPSSNTDRTITLPDSTDTLAVNSDVTNKLPLAGGTMSGNLIVNASVNAAGSGTGGGFHFADGNAMIYRDTNDMVFKLQGAEKIRLPSSGGITFNGDTAAANALDDYEEGESTIAIACSTSGSITLKSTHNKCVYTKVGRVVHFNIHIRVDSISSPVGSASITGLPFTCGANEKFRSAVAVAPVYNFASPSGSMALGYIVNNGTTMYVPFYNGSTQTLPSAGYFQVNTEAYITGSYMTD